MKSEVLEKATLNKQTLLLEGLEVLGEYYSLGLKERHLFDELKRLESEAKYHGERLGKVKEKEEAILDIVRNLRLVDNIVCKYEYKKSALIQILLDIQMELNWLPRHCLKWVSARLNIPVSNIYGITNFYETFSLEPRGAHLVQVPMCTACHVRGAAGLLDRVSSILGIEPGQTDSEQLFTLQSVGCMGCCALGLVVKIDKQYYINPTVTKLEEIFNTYRGKGEKPCQD